MVQRILSGFRVLVQGPLRPPHQTPHPGGGGALTSQERDRTSEAAACALWQDAGGTETMCEPSEQPRRSSPRLLSGGLSYAHGWDCKFPDSLYGT